MGRKCSVNGCRTGYDYVNKIKEKVTIYGFPKGREDRERWATSIPNTLSFNDVTKITKNMGVCALHWPSDVPLCPSGRYQVPAVPPSIFDNVPSQWDKLSNKARHKLLSVQNDYKDEVSGWIATDEITHFTLFCNEAKHYLGGNKWTYELDDDVNKGQECIRFNLLPDLPTLEEARLLFTITVFSDMQVKLFSGRTGDIPNDSLSWIFGNDKDEPPVLEHWSQFATLVSQCSTGVWVNRNTDNQCVYMINDLHQLCPDDEGDETMLSKVLGDCEANNMDSIGDYFDTDKNKLKILGLTQELYRVIFQRNQLIKKMKCLQQLADIDVDVFSLILDVDINPEGKTELDKVSKLVQTIMNDLEIGEGLNVLPLLVKQYWSLIENDNPFQRKSPSTQNNSSLPQDKSEIRVDDTEEEMNGDSNCGVIKDDNISDQSLVVNILYGEEQENQVDDDIIENSNNYSHLLETNSNDGDSLKKCQFCGNMFKFLDNHMLAKHKQELPPELLLGCNICGKEFLKLKSLNRHMQFTHRKGLPKDCTICGKRFKRPCLLKQHFYLHHSDERPHQCSVCGMTFKENATFKRHMKCVHSEQRPFNCSICNRRFKMRYNLVAHKRKHLNPDFKGRYIKRVDEAEDCYCTICHKHFLGSRNLEIHMACHPSYKPFKCKICGKSYKSRSSVCRHKITVHSEGRLHQCSLCPKSFKLKSRLKSHQLVHTKIGLFKCTLCDKTFKWLKSLQKHQVVHSEKTHRNERSDGVIAPGSVL